MKFYYTISSQPEDIQNNINNSIGGYKSGNSVSNSKFNSLFSDISEMMYNNQQDAVIGLMLKNETGYDVVAPSFWFEYPISPLVCYSKLEIAVVATSLDNELNEYIERLSDIHSLPFVGDFFEADGEVNKIMLPDIPKDSMLGIWFKRTVSKQAAITEYNASITKIGDVYQQSELSKEDSISLKVSW